MEDTVFLYVQGNFFFLFCTIYYFTILTSIFNVIMLKTDTRTGFLHLKRLLVFYMVISLFVKQQTYQVQSSALMCILLLSICATSNSIQVVTSRNCHSCHHSRWQYIILLFYKVYCQQSIALLIVTSIIKHIVLLMSSAQHQMGGIQVLCFAKEETV